MSVIKAPSWRPLRGRGRISSLAEIAVMAPAAFAVHQMRYLLAYGGHAGVELERTGHSYLHSVVPWLVLLLGLVVGGFLRSLGRACTGQTSISRYTTSLVGMWVACSSALVAIFICQEFLEGLFATGHPAGWIGIFGYGGWWAIPSALIVGLVLAAWFHGARWVLREVARRHARRFSRWAGPAIAIPRPTNVVAVAPAPLVGAWSGRGPPKRA